MPNRQNNVADVGNLIWLFTYLVTVFALPYGLLYVASSLFFIIKCPKHVITWIIVPFLLVHCLIPHKELRFLIPIMGLMPFILMYSLQLLQKRYPAQLNGPTLLAFNQPAWILNIFIVFFAAFIHLDFQLYKYIWAHYAHTRTFLNYYTKTHPERDPDNAVVTGMPLRFYVPEGLYVHNDNRMEQFVCMQHATCLAWIPCDDSVIKNKPNMYLVYDSCRVADLMRTQFDVAHWVERSALFRQNGRLYAFDNHSLINVIRVDAGQINVM